MSDDKNVPPPPGGYGGGYADPYRVPQAPPPLPPDDLPPTPKNTGRWAAGGIGIALLGLRACLLFGDTGHSSYSDYGSTNFGLPAFDPLAGIYLDGGAAIPMPKPPLGGGHIAVGKGDTLVVNDSNGEIQDDLGNTVCAGYCTTSDIVVVGSRVFWLTALNEELRAAPLSGDKPPEKVAELSNPDSSIATDGTSIYVVCDFANDEGHRAIVKVDPTTGKQTKLASVAGSIDDLRISGGRAYFTWIETGDHGTRHLQSVSTWGGAVSKLAESVMLDDAASITGAVGGGYYYVAYGDFSIPEHIGRVPIAGGAFQVLYDAPPEELLGAITADASGLYVARRAEGGWTISHLVMGSGATPKLDVTDLIEPMSFTPRSLTARSKDLVFASALGITHAPKTPVKTR
ncbi:hypothetical protein BH09MYX1_BH09MYX1_33290 [soil metagenome]